jgi:hypothetical protein
MILISHRGNLTGPNSCLENHPDSILKALNFGYDCEIDVWKIDGQFFLGHDEPQYKIEKQFFFENTGLWIHCKNFEALEDLSFCIDLPNNVFFHDKDDYTLTTKGVIWTYPGKKVGKNCVIVNFNKEKPTYDQIKGLCSDWVGTY